MNVDLDEWKARAEYAVARVVHLEAVCGEWKARAKWAEARLAEVEALCDQADEGYGEGIWGTDVSTAKIRAIIKETS